MQIYELALRAKNGDLNAFEQLYDSFAQRIYCHIKKKIQNKQDAEDVLQEVFIKGYKGLPFLRPGNLNFPAWLYKIASNTVNDHLRKKYRRPEIVAIDENFDVADQKSLYNEIVAKSDLETAKKQMDQLPARHKKIIELRFFRDLSVNEAASALNKSSLAVRMLQYRARKTLRHLSEKVPAQ